MPMVPMASSPQSPRFYQSARDAVIEAWIQEIIASAPSAPCLLPPHDEIIPIPAVAFEEPSPPAFPPLKRKNDAVSKAYTIRRCAPKRRAALAPIDSNMNRGRNPRTPTSKRVGRRAKNNTSPPPEAGSSTDEDGRADASDEVGEMEDQTPQPTTTRRVSARQRGVPSQTAADPSSSRPSLRPSLPPPAWPLNEADPALGGYTAGLSRLNMGDIRKSAPSETSSRRQRSPVKGLGDLLFVEKPITFVAHNEQHLLPDDVRDLCSTVDDINAGFGVIPSSIFSDILAEGQNLSPGEKIRPQYKSQQEVQAPESFLRQELHTLCNIVHESQRASPGGYSEAHWNTRVHSAIMVAAIEADQSRHQRSTEVLDTTVATIATGCVPRNANGVSLVAKMVDFCIVLSDPDIREASLAAVAAEQQLGKGRKGKRPGVSSSASSASSVSAADMSAADDDRVPPSSINHTEYFPLRTQPIAVSIETKQPNGSDEEAKAQLSVWVSAHLLRLHQLFRSLRPIPLTLPLLYVRGSQWQLCFAVERENRIDIIETYKVEGTGTLLGCYKVLSLLRALRQWSTTVFQERFLELLAGAAI